VQGNVLGATKIVVGNKGEMTGGKRFFKSGTSETAFGDETLKGSR
jgi:hypothetical protein